MGKETTFTVTPIDANITKVNFYYGIQNWTTDAIFDWQNAGRMLPDANVNFTLVFQMKMLTLISEKQMPGSTINSLGLADQAVWLAAARR